MRKVTAKKICRACSLSRNVWTLFISLILSLGKGFIGILGSSESLVADGLYSFYQSFIAFQTLVGEEMNNRFGKVYKSVWFAGLVISLILIIGAADVCVFSLIRINKAAQGLLPRPSPYGLYIAVLSVMANYLLYKYSLCSGKRDAEGNVPGFALSQSLCWSIIVSVITLTGIFTARKVSLYGDAVAGLVLVIIISFKAGNLLGRSWGITTACLAGISLEQYEQKKSIFGSP